MTAALKFSSCEETFPLSAVYSLACIRVYPVYLAYDMVMRVFILLNIKIVHKVHKKHSKKTSNKEYFRL